MGNLIEHYKEVYEENPIRRSDELSYIKMKDTYESFYRKIKFGSIIVFAILVLLHIYLNKENILLFELPIFNSFLDMFTYKIIGYLIVACFYVVVTFLLHLIAYKSIIKIYITTKGNQNNKINNREFLRLKLVGVVSNFKRLFFFCWRVFNWVVSPDYEFAKHYKNRFKELYYKNKECQCDKRKIYTNTIDDIELCIQCYDTVRFMNKFFIKFSNWLNLVTTSILGSITLILTMFYPNNFLISFLFALIIYRIISRSFEIIIAFYQDVVHVNARIFIKGFGGKKYLHAWKNSFIRKPMRISLAVHSLLEILILFTIVYFLIFNLFGSELLISDSIDYSIENQQIVENPVIENYITQNKIYEFLLYAISVTFFNVSYVNYGYWLWTLLHVWQVFLSIVLIILSIAAYLGFSDEVYERERNFYNKVLHELKKE
ncbi:hypothetical protein [Guptibacillus hwajinpoensis]|uniref:hypothetical protein n=1 Tax=Guptibacillus hwajinpoensis TaxID=208199 RepID=UPI0024B3C303|nr:hypothetical protein [Pseudalkalibacillus hwajinpoensis]